MSGTSLDGADAVLVDLASPRPRILASSHRPFATDLWDELLGLNSSGPNELERAALAGSRLAGIYAECAKELLVTVGVAPEEIQAIGCHGQTVRHRPDLGFSIQIGQPARLVELTRIPVVADFRSRDLAAGGQGAPLVPAFHKAVFAEPSRSRAIVNIGGISNLTWLPRSGPVIGFDAGPGNVLMDAWCLAQNGKRFDRDGAWAEQGRTLSELLADLLSEPFFRAPPPKSTGRDLFSLDWLKRRLPPGASPQDVQATLLALTVQSIAGAVRDHCPGCEEVYLCGGGARNTALVRGLTGALAGIRVGLTQDLGIDAMHVEALAFAWLAQQAILGRPGNLPAVTGARHECILGAIYPELGR